MLSPLQTQEIRDKVQAAKKRPFRDPYHWAHYVNGPLAGLQIKLGSALHGQPGANFGCCYTTKRGLMVANHVRVGTPDQWRFSGFDRPGHRGSGHAA